MTPRQLDARAREYADQREESLQLIRVQAYLTAMLVSGFVGRSLKGKNIPAFAEVFREKKKEMSDEDMLAAVIALNAKLGGEDLRKEADTDGNC